MTEKLSPEESIWGWKLLIITFILSLVFMSIFYLAVNNQPDYMPSQQKKIAQVSEPTVNSAHDHTNHPASPPETQHQH